MTFFTHLLNAFVDLNKILLAEAVEETDTYLYIDSKIPTPYFNFAIPKTTVFSHFPLPQIEAKYLEKGKDSTIYLLEEHQKAGFAQNLADLGYSSVSEDTWVGFDLANEISKSRHIITEVSFENFGDFDKVLKIVFSDFLGNDAYQNVIKQSLRSVVDNIYGDLVSKAYVIYGDNNPVSGGALLYSKIGNFAYLHDAGTLEEARGKGCQTELIRLRTRLVRDLGISNIFSLVEFDSVSHRNMLKNGFKTIHRAILFSKATP